MSIGTTAERGTDPDDKGLYRIGGLSALVLGLGYLVIFPVYARVGAPPTGDGAAFLAYLTGKTGTWWIILALSVLTDLLFVPLGLALYVALRPLNRNAMLLGTACMGLFVVLDLAVTWTQYASLLTLTDRYVAATSDVQRSAYVAAANVASAVLTSRLLIVYAIAILSSGILMIGVVMLKGVFSRTTAWLGVLTGVLGLVSLAGWGVTIIMNAVCATLWVLFVGYRLNQLARP